MFKCPFCGAKIDGRTDDNYNIDHSKIKCQECGEWRYALRDYACDTEEVPNVELTGGP